MRVKRCWKNDENIIDKRIFLSGGIIISSK
jgi:hypothetical protein